MIKGSNTPSNKIPICGTSLISLKLKKKYNKLGKISKKGSSGRVLYKNEAQLSLLNLYLASVVGYSYANLSSYKGVFKIFFNQKNNPSWDKYSLAAFGKIVVPKIIPPEYKDSIINAFNLMTDFLNIKTLVADSYDQADYIVTIGDTGVLGSANYPAALDQFPDIFNGQNYVAFDTIALTITPEIGGSFFWAVIHEICHTLGLAHPFDTANNSQLMPGCNEVAPENLNDAYTNMGFFYMNNQLSTLMAYSPIYNTKLFKTTLTNPRTLMELDLQALRYFYNIKNYDKYINNWISFIAQEDVVQTIVSNSKGASLNLVQFFEITNVYNLNLDKFIANPAQDGKNALSMISSTNNQYPVFVYDDTLTTLSIVDGESFISKVYADFKIFNVYASFIKNNVEITCGTDFITEMNIFLKCKKSNYKITSTKNYVYIQNKINHKILKVLNSSNVNVSVNFAINN